MLNAATNPRWVVLFPVNAKPIAISSELVPSVDLGQVYGYVANDTEDPVLIHILTGT